VSTAIPAHLGPGFTHVVTPLATSHGTLVTPVPVTVVSQGNQVAHIITAASGKVLYINFIPYCIAIRIYIWVKIRRRRFKVGK